MLLIALALLLHLLLGAAITAVAHRQGRGHEVPGPVVVRGATWGAAVVAVGTATTWASLTLLGREHLLSPEPGAGLLWLALGSLVLPVLWWGGWTSLYAPRLPGPGEPYQRSPLAVLKEYLLAEDLDEHPREDDTAPPRPAGEPRSAGHR